MPYMHEFQLHPNQENGGISHGQFVSDVQAIRQRARLHMEQAAVTEGYKANRDAVVKVLNEVLATEIVCTLRYRRHYYTATGLHAEAVKSEFLKHANEELQHADSVAVRIVQLNGAPELNPEIFRTRGQPEFGEATALADMLKEDLFAERIAVESYTEIVRWLDNDDPTSRRVMEEILKVEEEHAEELKSLLEHVS